MEMGPGDDSPRLPVELLHLVAQHIRTKAIEEKDRDTVKACSLVFSAWTIFFQRALFKIKVPYLLFSTGTPVMSRDGYELRDLLEANPGFGKALTSFHLDMMDTGTPDPDHETGALSLLLSHLTSIDTLRIRQRRPPARYDTWSILPNDTQAALRDLFRSPSLRNLSISSFHAPLAILFPKGAEKDTVKFFSGRIPKVRDDYGLPNDSGFMLELRPFTRSCIIRNLTSTAELASRLVRATHQGGQSDGVPIIDSSGIHTAQIMMGHRSQLQELHAFLQHTHNLKKLLIGGTYLYLLLRSASVLLRPPDPLGAAGIEGLFQEPHARCLGTVEEIELLCHWESLPEILLPDILHEFSAYPPENVVKRVIMNIPSFAPGILPLPTEEVKSQLLALAELLSKTSRFPLLECVEMIAETELGFRFRMGRWDEDAELKFLLDTMTGIVMGLPKMRLGFDFTVRTKEQDT